MGLMPHTVLTQKKEARSQFSQCIPNVFPVSHFYGSRTAPYSRGNSHCQAQQEPIKPAEASTFI